MKKLFLIFRICSLLIIVICVGLRYSTHANINKGSQEIDSLNTIGTLKTLKKEVDIDDFVELKADPEERYHIKISSESHIHKAHKHVLIIVGENSDSNECNLMCNRFADGVKEVGGEVEILYLCDYDIPYYDFQGAYRENYHKLDESIETDSIIHKMIKADIIVFEETISPVGVEWGSHGRLGYLRHRYENGGLEIRDKEFFYLSTVQKYASHILHVFRDFAGATIDAIERGYALNPQEAYKLGKSI